MVVNVCVNAVVAH